MSILNRCAMDQLMSALCRLKRSPATVSRHIPGPIVFIDPIMAMVPVSSPVRFLRDFEGLAICVMIGSPAQRALEANLSQHQITPRRLAFEEEVEILDAYNVGNCDAMVGDTT
jgi:general L-amino acid transport system substrate-binding protein